MGYSENYIQENIRYRNCLEIGIVLPFRGRRRGGYTSVSLMKLQLTSRLVAFILALSLARAVLPVSASAWQCQYSRPIVGASTSITPNMMACAMGGASTQCLMPCCRHHLTAASHARHGVQELCAPGCHTSLIPFASPVPVKVSVQRCSQRTALAPMAAATPGSVSSRKPGFTHRSRPPDLSSSFQSARLASTGLRAPPIA